VQTSFLGEIQYFSFPIPPTGWAACNGQLLSINLNAPLFSLLGTTYGGDGLNTFALPDLRGRVPVGQGQGHSLNPYSLGQKDGQEGVALTVQQIPAHTHAATAVDKPAATPVASPAGNLLSVVGNPNPIKTYGTGNLAAMSGTTVASSGGGQTHENRMPYLALNPCIATSGIYPTRP